MKKYLLTYEDADGNALTSKIVEADSRAEVAKYVSLLQPNDKLNNLYTIKIRQL